MLAALRAAQWIISEAARDLGVSRQGLKKAMARHKIAKRLPSRAAMTRFLSEAGQRGGRPRKPREDAA